MGHDAEHVRDVGLGTASDQAIFAVAARDRRIVITADLDFADIIAASGSATVSAILLRLRDTSPAHGLARLTAVLAACTEPLAEGAIVIVAESRLRIRRLPIAP